MPVAYILQASQRAIEWASFELSSAARVEKYKIRQCHRDVMRHFQRKTAVDGAFSASQTVQGSSEPLKLCFIRRHRSRPGIDQVAHTDTIRAPSVVMASAVLFATAVVGENKAIEDVGTPSNTSTAQL
ncbi:hypothetical protein FRB95_002912 [Tulasnella sp. JGI-2019a]|nr:hypothetical protein FRB95_002912 [Tulasnella sp. JGI-2019a]